MAKKVEVVVDSTAKVIGKTGKVVMDSTVNAIEKTGEGITKFVS